MILLFILYLTLFVFRGIFVPQLCCSFCLCSTENFSANIELSLSVFLKLFVACGEVFGLWQLAGVGWWECNCTSSWLPSCFISFQFCSQKRGYSDLMLSDVEQIARTHLKCLLMQFRVDGYHLLATIFQYL